MFMYNAGLINQHYTKCFVSMLSIMRFNYIREVFMRFNNDFFWTNSKKNFCLFGKTMQTFVCFNCILSCIVFSNVFIQSTDLDLPWFTSRSGHTSTTIWLLSLFPILTVQWVMFWAGICLGQLIWDLVKLRICQVTWWKRPLDIV